MTNFVIAISGISGAGKTALVKKTAQLLGDAATIHFDDYQPVAQYPSDMVRWIDEGKDLDAWVIPQLLADLQGLRNGRPIVHPISGQTVQPAKYIVLEEPSGRARKGLRELVDYVVFIDIPFDIALARKVVAYFAYCAKETAQDELRQVVQVGVDYYAKYSLSREYYLTLIESVRQDYDLILDGLHPTDDLAQMIVKAISTLVLPK